MNIFSAFDGMAIARLAAHNVGFHVNNYFASEINKPAIKVAKSNWGDIQHVGNVVDVKGCDYPKIDLFVGGSPCQGFSYAGKMLNFDDPRSKLFFEYVRLLGEFRKINPEIAFVLENVRMKPAHAKIISDYLGIDYVVIDSKRVSAQNRIRYYWTNIKARQTDLFGGMKGGIIQPKDRKIYLKDILQPIDEVHTKYFLSEKAIKNQGLEFAKKIDISKLPAIGATKFGRDENAKAVRRENLKNGVDYSPFASKEVRGIDPLKMNTMTASSAKDNVLFLKLGYDGKVRADQAKASCLAASGEGFHSDMDVICMVHANNVHIGMGINFKIDGNGNVYAFRRLTPIEAERLQTLPDNYTAAVADSPRYEMIGNGFTSAVIEHIFSHL